MLGSFDDGSATGKRLEELPVSQAMSKEVYSARVGQSVESAGALMRNKQVRRLPIVDGAAGPRIPRWGEAIFPSAATTDTVDGEAASGALGTATNWAHGVQHPPVAPEEGPDL